MQLLGLEPALASAAPYIEAASLDLTDASPDALTCGEPRMSTATSWARECMVTWASMVLLMTLTRTEPAAAHPLPVPAATPTTTPPIPCTDPAVTLTEPVSVTVELSTSALMVEVTWL